MYSFVYDIILIPNLANLIDDAEESEEAPGACKKNGDNVANCLKKSLISANQAYEARSELAILYVELLNKYSYFFEKKCEQIALKEVTRMFEYSKSRLEALDACDAQVAAAAYLDNTKKHIKTLSDS
jgi:hypothetical protein